MIFKAVSAFAIRSSSLLPMKTLSPAVLAGIRGGGSTATVVLQDFGREAAGYFEGMRTPASLIIGASLGALFTPTNQVQEMKAKTRVERLCTRFYNSCVLASFMLSLCAVVTATAAGVTILHADFDRMAESGYHLLMKEFEFEFITTRLSYLTSLLTFVVGITGRILLEFNLLQEERRDEAFVVTFAMTAIATHLWSYINSTLYSSQSLAGLAVKLCQIVVRRALHQHRPLQLVSLACSALTGYFFARVLFKKKGKPRDAIL